MKVSDLRPEQIKLGLRVKGVSRWATVVSYRYDGELVLPWFIKFDDAEFTCRLLSCYDVLLDSESNPVYANELFLDFI
jgi:hypothetical protein